MSITQMILKVLRFIEIVFIAELVLSIIYPLYSMIVKKEGDSDMAPLTLGVQCIYMIKAWVPALYARDTPLVPLSTYDWITWGIIFFCIAVRDTACVRGSHTLCILSMEFFLLKYFNLIEGTGLMWLAWLFGSMQMLIVDFVVKKRIS